MRPTLKFSEQRDLFGSLKGSGPPRQAVQKPQRESNQMPLTSRPDDPRE